LYVLLLAPQLIRLSVSVKSFERPTQWLPLVHPFSQENQMLTPKMSLRRTVVTATYKDKIDLLYAGKGHKVSYPRGHKDE
jgi:long-subunit acyl-CoA synthetase (AMP-forming)